MRTDSWRPHAGRGFVWGAAAGLALVALMYLAGTLLGLRPLPQALSGPVLAIMPGFVFGFLIDTLQHAGKVVEEFGLIVAMVVGLGVLGAAPADIWSWVPRAQRRPDHSAGLGVALRDLRRDPADGVGRPPARPSRSRPPAHARRGSARDRRCQPGCAGAAARARLVSRDLQSA